MCPARLYYKGAAWYLQAFCLSRMAFRTFRISRISRLQASGQTFDPLPPPPPIEETSSLSAAELRLRFPAHMAYRVYDEFDGESILLQDDGSLIVQTCMPIDDGWIYGYLLSFGGDAEVLSPPEVQYGLAQRARHAWLTYQKDFPKSLTEDVMVSPVCSSYPTGEQDDRQEDHTMEQKFCQSCGMPLGDDEKQYGTEKDGSLNHDYCTYCYQQGAFTQDCTMQEMIDFCVPFMLEGHPAMDEAGVRSMMAKFFPMLKRWAQS